MIESITSTGATTLTAARDVILQSAQNSLATQSKSSSSGVSIGASVGVAVVGGVTASASVNVGASKSSGSSSEVTQVNTSVVAGGTLTLTTGRDATLKGAVAEGRDVIASIGRDLSVTSVQDETTRKSSSAGFSAGLTLAAGAGLGGNGSVNVGKGSGSSAIVSEQTALLAREGSLAATVKGNTDLKGGVIAALNADGSDSGKLALSTGTLTASDIKDSAKSKDISVGISASVNNITDKAKRSGNLPVVDGSFASSSFAQDTKATIGQGVLNVGAPDSNVTLSDGRNTASAAALNRDISASQVVTKDKSTGFTLYADVAAAKELVSTVKGIAGNENAAANSVILTGVKNIKERPLGLIQDVVGEVKALTDATPFNSKVEELTATVGLIIGTLNEKSIARKLASAPLPPEAQKAIGALESLATKFDAVITTARKAGDSAGEAAAIKAQDEAYAAIDLIQDGRLTESNASSIKGRLIGGSNPGALATTRTKRSEDSSGNASSTYVAGNSPDGGTGPEGGTPPVPGAGGPLPGQDIVVTANTARENTTVGRVVVDALDYTKTKIESFSPLTRELAVGGVRAVLTGGTGPLISVAVNQGAGKALEYVPQSLLRPIAEAGNYINRFIGDGGSSFLLSKDFTGVRTDESTATRRDSSATTFGITTLFGVALGPITVKARELLKGSPKVDVPNGPIQVGEVTSYRDFKKRSVTGDNIEGDHIPSAAALIAAKEKEFGR